MTQNDYSHYLWQSNDFADRCMCVLIWLCIIPQVSLDKQLHSQRLDLARYSLLLPVGGGHFIFLQSAWLFMQSPASILSVLIVFLLKCRWVILTAIMAMTRDGPHVHLGADAYPDTKEEGNVEKDEFPIYDKYKVQTPLDLEAGQKKQDSLLTGLSEDDMEAADVLFSLRRILSPGSLHVSFLYFLLRLQAIGAFAWFSSFEYTFKVGFHACARLEGSPVMWMNNFSLIMKNPDLSQRAWCWILGNKAQALKCQPARHPIQYFIATRSQTAEYWCLDKQCCSIVENAIYSVLLSWFSGTSPDLIWSGKNTL